MQEKEARVDDSHYHQPLATASETEAIRATASPTPWRYRPGEEEDGEPICGAQVCDADGASIFTVDTGAIYCELSDAQALRIVTAVNAYPELVAALKAIDVILDAVTMRTDNGVELIGPCVADIREAATGIKAALATADGR